MPKSCKTKFGIGGVSFTGGSSQSYDVGFKWTTRNSGGLEDPWSPGRARADLQNSKDWRARRLGGAAGLILHRVKASSYVYMCIDMYTHVCICYLHIHICIYICEYVNTYLDIHIHTYIHTYIHTCTCIHTNTCADIHFRGVAR